MNYQLDFKMIENKGELHQYLKEKLGFPDYYGNNLDALYDELTDLEDNTIIEIKNFNFFQEKELKYSNLLLEVFNDVIDQNPSIQIIINK
ncbi:MAG: barstar family protein [Bacilli bacterium]|nr:barstar family protein [Bacilli bacterium]